ncbi:hypothetical protein RND71_043649 [Anisodus tanguticus]|uniref:Uncharacterized protein n=1 Tax=Anisodus tanguticus TaxID=243964 RepID=A0AAE1QPC8_9SOLA|nr:hypothetical protein RND71_043649 [Anisodus tanguticus]
MSTVFVISVELNSLNHNQQHRERAVDVPESFIAVVKQAPRYPPPQSDQKFISKKEFNKPNFNYQNININNNKVGYEPERLLKYSEEIERRKKSQEEFLRTSLRSSIKLNSNGRSSVTKSFKDSRKAIVNDAFEDEDYSSFNNLPNLTNVLDDLITNLNDNKFKELVEKSNLENNLKIYQTIVDNNQKNKADLVGNLNLLSSDDLLFEAICILRLQDDPSLNQEVLELFNILSDSNFKMLFSTFEEIFLKMKRDLNNSIDSDNLMKINKLRNLEDLKIVNLKKSNCEPLGITIKSDMDGSVVIGRIVKGGTADKSGLLNENEEILEINGIELRGRNLSQICDMLSDMNGTLTFVIAPKDPIRLNMQKSTFIHLKALYDYDPEDDIYIPCRELGICFNKGDILHVIDQTDQNWWQAYKEGEHEQNLAGLIPSIYFQIQRESMKKSLINETDSNKYKNKKSILCGLKRKKKNNFKNDINEEILTYEEVHLYYPKANMKRPIVLIGPTNIGRHELRQRIMLDTERFAAAVPHTSRNRRDGEMDGVDYHFITRNEFELDFMEVKVKPKPIQVAIDNPDDVQEMIVKDITNQKRVLIVAKNPPNFDNFDEYRYEVNGKSNEDAIRHYYENASKQRKGYWQSSVLPASVTYGVFLVFVISITESKLKDQLIDEFTKILHKPIH